LTSHKKADQLPAPGLADRPFREMEAPYAKEVQQLDDEPEWWEVKDNVA
jgi:hypothetical protein